MKKEHTIFFYDGICQCIFSISQAMILSDAGVSSIQLSTIRFTLAAPTAISVNQWAPDMTLGKENSTTTMSPAMNVRQPK